MCPSGATYSYGLLFHISSTNISYRYKNKHYLKKAFYWLHKDRIRLGCLTKLQGNPAITANTLSQEDIIDSITSQSCLLMTDVKFYLPLMYWTQDYHKCSYQTNWHSICKVTKYKVGFYYHVTVFSSNVCLIWSRHCLDAST